MWSTGASVRKLLNKAAFDKGAERWSHRIYTISSKVQHHFVLNDGSTARNYELQVVHPETKPLEIDVEEKIQTKKMEGKTKRAQSAAGVPVNRDEFDGSVFVGRKLSVPGTHFKEYKGLPEAKKNYAAVVVNSSKSRGNPRKNFDWHVRYEGSTDARGFDETMNLSELEKFMVT